MEIKEIHPETDERYLCLVVKGSPVQTFCSVGYENVEVAPVFDDSTYYRVGDEVTEFLYDCTNKNKPIRIRSGEVAAVLPDGNIQLLITPVL